MTDQRRGWMQTLAARAERISWPRAFFFILAIIAIQVTTELAMGRVPMCTCSTIKLWVGSVQSPENSQQIFDWYTFTHIIHGLGLYGLIWLAAPRAPIALRLLLAVAAEGTWEMVENTNFIIDRYRADPISLNYRGDSIVNSVSDTVTTIFGFMLAWRLPVWMTVALAVSLEVFVGYEIRDNLTLNIIMLIYPFEAIRTWQGGA